jgi:hypothetical protein
MDEFKGRDNTSLLQQLTDERMTVELLTRYGSGRVALQQARERYDKTREEVLRRMNNGHAEPGD